MPPSPTAYPVERLVKNNEFIVANDKAKMSLLKLVVETLGCQERNAYYLGNNGNIFLNVPPRTFFRENYDKFNLEYYYHKDLNDTSLDNSFLPFIIKVRFKDELLLTLNAEIDFSKEISNKLSVKIKLDIVDNFNFIITEHSPEI